MGLWREKGGCWNEWRTIILWTKMSLKDGVWGCWKWTIASWKEDAYTQRSEEETRGSVGDFLITWERSSLLRKNPPYNIKEVLIATSKATRKRSLIRRRGRRQCWWLIINIDQSLFRWERSSLLKTKTFFHKKAGFPLKIAISNKFTYMYACAFVWLLKQNNLWMSYTGWPRKNATTLIVNFKDIVNKTN